MAASCSRVILPSIFVPSEIPLFIAQVRPAAYHGLLPDVSTPSRRARIVTIIPRVVFAFGLNSFADVPFIRPFSRTYWTASKYQLFLDTSTNFDASGFAVSSFGLLGLEGVTGVTGFVRSS